MTYFNNNILNKILLYIKKYTIINCNLKNKQDVINWINYKIKKNNMYLTKNAKENLYNYYKKNLIHITQLIYKCKILYYKKKINSTKIKKIIFNSLHLNYNEIVNLFFSKKIKKNIEIINNINIKEYNILLIIKKLYEKLIKIIMLKNKKKIYIINTLDKNIIQMSEEKIYKIIRYITLIEIYIKKNKNINILEKLKILLLIIKK